ncbi:MAG: cytochrome c [Verrucomicrobiota bacterium]
MKLILPIFLAVSAVLRADPLLTYDTRPAGSPETPLIISTYLPDPGLESGVFQHYHTGKPVPKYSPEKGIDLPGEEPAIAGISAALAVNFGPSLSYVFDTVECRPLYAWQGGFLDFAPYWGDQARGSRVSFGYVPQLVGTLFSKAEGKHPLSIDDKPVGAPTYTGYKLEKGIPRFYFKSGRHVVNVKITSDAKPLCYHAEWNCNPPARLTFHEGDLHVSGEGRLEYTRAGKVLGQFKGYELKVDLTKASKNAGAVLFNSYGCATCHSIDGSNGHGPTLTGVAEHQVSLEDGTMVTADATYLEESLRLPNAKIVKGYPPNYMPPYVLRDVEIQSLVRYIQSIPKPE